MSKDMARWHGLQRCTIRILGEANRGPVPSPCWDLPGTNDILVILRTGSTELDHRFPVHRSTTLQCYKHHLVFSDLEEHYHGEHILDALESVDINIRENHKDFDLYRRLKSHGRAALNTSELSGSPAVLDHMSGHVQNPGWKLDKWKFMPMVNTTFHKYPNMKWYVFVEADTFLLWPMLLQYLSLLDHTKAHYVGAGACLGNHLFAHGGSGFVVSHPAMQAVTQHYAAHKSEIEALTDREWAGDFILGKAFNDAGVPTTDAWPHFQGDYPGLVAYAGPDGRYAPAASLREWCYPTISYHHMSPEMIRDLWVFEQRWLSANPNRTDTLTHGDIFKDFVLPQMMTGKADWDNLSDNDEQDATSMEACRAKCEVQPDCKQYSFTMQTKQCKTRVDPRLGTRSNGTRSYWMQARVLEFARTAAPCGRESWQVGVATRRTTCK
ncbi:hypothetical protein BDZ85DRAFT_272954 [Elsinoe ampelina]|uniref:Apple domain-containing protein n=1 Tax=Elsinoe ampelina TaxID=302913 RepID=A0A6A6GHM8_9PEZI|nr:hypothetical protein BDZ85DRAFT_272954 [Elsinoe ampelina]